MMNILTTHSQIIFPPELTWMTKTSRFFTPLYLEKKVPIILGWPKSSFGFFHKMFHIWSRGKREGIVVTS